MDTTSNNNLALQPRTGTQGSGGTNESSKVRYAGLNYYSLPPKRLLAGTEQALKNSSGILKVFFDQEGLRDWARSKEAGIVALVPENDNQDTTPFMDFTILLHEIMTIYTDTVLSIRLCEQYHGFRSNKPHILLRTLFHQILNQLDPVKRTGLDLATSNATFHYSFELITDAIKDALGLLPKNTRPYIFLHDLQDCLNYEGSDTRPAEISKFLEFLRELGSSQAKIMLTGLIPTNFHNVCPTCFVHKVSHQEVVTPVPKLSGPNTTPNQNMGPMDLKLMYLKPILLELVSPS